MSAVLSWITVLALEPRNRRTRCPFVDHHDTLVRLIQGVYASPGSLEKWQLFLADLCHVLHSTTARVRVTWTSNAAVHDLGNVNFRIQ